MRMREGEREERGDHRVFCYLSSLTMSLLTMRQTAEDADDDDDGFPWLDGCLFDWMDLTRCPTSVPYELNKAAATDDEDDADVAADSHV